MLTRYAGIRSRLRKSARNGDAFFYKAPIHAINKFASMFWNVTDVTSKMDISVYKGLL